MRNIQKTVHISYNIITANTCRIMEMYVLKFDEVSDLLYNIFSHIHYNSERLPQSRNSNTSITSYYAPAPNRRGH